MHSNGQALFSAQAANGHSFAMNVDNSRHVMLAIVSDNLANLRLRVKGSIAQDAPNFSLAQAPDNMWGYIMLKDLNDGTTINGVNGVSFSGTDGVYFLEVNTNGLKHICVELDNYTAGDVTVYGRAFTEV